MVFQVPSNPNHSISSGEDGIEVFVVYFLSSSKSCDLLQENWTELPTHHRAEQEFLSFSLRIFIFQILSDEGAVFFQLSKFVTPHKPPGHRKTAPGSKISLAGAEQRRTKPLHEQKIKNNQMEQSRRQVWQN